MKKILLTIVSSSLLLVSCKKDLTTLNDDPKNPTTVFAYSLVTNAERGLARTMSSSNVNLNIFRLTSQQWNETTYMDESRYDLDTRNIPQNLWSAFYRDVLSDLNAAKKLIPSQITDADVAANQLAIIEVLQVYSYYYLVSAFGNIPYTDALDIDNVFPAYDDAATIYSDLLTRLNSAIPKLKTSAAGFGSADIIYGNNIAGWKKFANSLKLKMGMTIADANATLAKTTVESAVTGGVFTSNSDNALFRFLSAPPNTNPVWEDLVQSGRKDFVAANTIVDKMKSLDDPRIPFYFTADGAGGYSGGQPGRSSSYTTFSKPAVALTVQNFPGDLLDYSEVEFLLAEAVNRGFAVGGTAATHYTAAVTASILFWGGTATDATVYLAQPEVAYATATGTYKQKIGEQKWIALYNRGFDAWNEWKRLDYPVLPPAYRALSAIPVRFTYPVNEQNYNTNNYNKAATDIGGDDVTTKVFWDKF